MVYRRTPQVQARLDAQHAAILVCAADLLGDEGFAACTIAAVAARAGVATGTVYNHFDGKPGLLRELFRRIAMRELDVVRAAVTAVSAVTAGSSSADTNALDQLSAIIETFAGRALKNPRRAYALLAEPVDAAMDELRLEFRRAFRDVIATAVAAGVERGELPPQNATLVGAAIVGAIGEALIIPLAAGIEDPDTVPTLITVIHRAVGGRARADS